MKYLILLIPFISISAFASEGIGGMAQDALDFFDLTKFFITDGIPSFFERLLAYLIEYYVYLKFHMYLETLKMSWNIAKIILEDLSISDNLSTMFNYLPPSLRAFAFDCRIVDAINVVLNAYVTRIVFRMF